MPEKAGSGEIFTDVTFRGNVVLGDQSTDTLTIGAATTVTGSFAVSGALTITGALQLSNTLTVGVDDTGYDVKLFGATAGAYLLWDESADSLVTAGAVKFAQADNTWAAATTTAYFRSSCSATSGEHIALRARCESEAAGASTGDFRGLYAQGISNEALYAGTVTGVFGNAIGKNTTTAITLRAGFFEAETEATPTAITNIYGIHTRTKSHVDPSSDYILHLLETEKVATGFALDSFIAFKTTTWAGGDTVATDVITTAALTGTVTNIINYSTVTATSFAYSDATITNFLETSADSKGGAGATRGTPNQTATCDGSIVVKIGAKTLLIPLYNAVTIA